MGQRVRVTEQKDILSQTWSANTARSGGGFLDTHAEDTFHMRFC